MTKTQFIITSGLIVAVLPFLGFPGNVRDTIIVLFGVLIAITGFLLGRRVKHNEHNKTSVRRRSTDMFIDNKYEHADREAGTPGISEEEHKTAR